MEDTNGNSNLSKQQYYINLHMEIGKSLGIGFKTVQMLRNYFYAAGKVFPEIARIVEKETVRLYPFRKESKKFAIYKEATEFMKRATQSELQALIRKAPYAGK